MRMNGCDVDGKKKQVVVLKKGEDRGKSSFSDRLLERGNRNAVTIGAAPRRRRRARRSRGKFKNCHSAARAALFFIILFSFFYQAVAFRF